MLFTCCTTRSENRDDTASHAPRNEESVRSGRPQILLSVNRSFVAQSHLLAILLFEGKNSTARCVSKNQIRSDTYFVKRFSGLPLAWRGSMLATLIFVS